MSTELDTEPALGDAPPCWPPVAHLVEHGAEIKPGAIALCGEKLMGIPLPDAEHVCEKCIKVAQQRL